MAKDIGGLINTFKNVTPLILIGVAWGRLEYKSDRQVQEIKEALAVYVEKNEGDKKMLGYQLGELKNQVDVNTLTIKAITEFVKPEDVRRRRYDK